MIHRWIHRRAVLAWLLLPWLALLLIALGLIAIDLTLGDSVATQDWAQRVYSEWLWQGFADLPLLMAGLYACGSVAWALGVLMGGRSARRASLVLGLLCGAGGLMLGGLVGLSWHRPASLVLGGVALLIGGLYAALTHRPRLRVQRRQTWTPVSPPAPAPAPIAPARPPVAPPVPTLMPHEPPTTQPVEY
ncbi:hypothetical protein [uncultured Sphaerotilus sp.]|uniref:hypothetical protein n=1 Tax=uncultured Sphaerotilus sp. TaxID=474984 RepID=UPI0030CA29B9